MLHVPHDLRFVSNVIRCSQPPRRLSGVTALRLLQRGLGR